jgi:hypothetical protein
MVPASMRVNPQSRITPSTHASTHAQRTEPQRLDDPQRDLLRCSGGGGDTILSPHGERVAAASPRRAPQDRAQSTAPQALAGDEERGERGREGVERGERRGEGAAAPRAAWPRPRAPRHEPLARRPAARPGPQSPPSPDPTSSPARPSPRRQGRSSRPWQALVPGRDPAAGPWPRARARRVVVRR